MKFSILANEFVQALSIVLKGTASRTTLPILSGILIDATGGELSFRASNLETFVKHSIPALIEEEGKTVVPGKFFIDIIKSLPNEAVQISSAESMKKIQVSCGTISFLINTLDAEDFSQFPEMNPNTSITLPTTIISTMVHNVSRASSNDSTRPILTGILLEADSKNLVMVATDSYRVAKQEVILETEIVEPFSVVVPGSIFSNIVSSSLGEKEIFIGYSENQIIFTFGRTTFITRRIEGNFPNYRKVFPAEKETSVTTSTEALLNAMKRIRIMANTSPTKNSSIKLSVLPDLQALEISAQYTEIGGGVERIDAAIEGISIDIAFNPSYIIDGLEGITSDETIIELQSAARPCVFKSSQDDNKGNFMYLAMPVRVN